MQDILCKISITHLSLKLRLLVDVTYFPSDNLLIIIRSIIIQTRGHDRLNNNISLFVPHLSVDTQVLNALIFGVFFPVYYYLIVLPLATK